MNDTGELARMGCHLDLMDAVSHHGARGLAEVDASNRRRLGALMDRCGFYSYEREWWHYTLKDEPHPDTSFDFPIVVKEDERAFLDV